MQRRLFFRYVNFIVKKRKSFQNKSIKTQQGCNWHNFQYTYTYDSAVSQN